MDKLCQIVHHVDVAVDSARLIRGEEHHVMRDSEKPVADLE